jgi:hypothetical protein
MFVWCNPRTVKQYNNLAQRLGEAEAERVIVAPAAATRGQLHTLYINYVTHDRSTILQYHHAACSMLRPTITISRQGRRPSLILIVSGPVRRGFILYPCVFAHMHHPRRDENSVLYCSLLCSGNSITWTTSGGCEQNRRDIAATCW